MIIKSLDIKGYGKFINKRMELKSGVNIVYGSNEAGKSTLYSLIQSLLYGFAPANIEKHPYASGYTNNIDFNGVIASEDGKEILVHRKLGSTPKASYFVEDKKHNLKNEGLPGFSRLSRNVYKGIYTLRTEDIVGLDTSLWDSIEDKLLSNYGILGIKKPRTIISDMQRDMDKIYKKTRRGKSQVRELRERLKSLRSDRNNMMALEKEIRGADRKYSQCKSELNDLNRDRQNLVEMINTLEDILPYYEACREINELEKQLELYEVYSRAPEECEAVYKEASEEYIRLSNRKKEILSAIDRLQASYTQMSIQDEGIIDNIDTINMLIRNLNEVEAKNTIKQERESELRRLGKTLNDDVFSIMFFDIDSSMISRIQGLNKHSILGMIKDVDNKKKQRDELSIKHSMIMGKTSVDISLSKLYIVALLLGLLAPLGRFINNEIVLYLGAVSGMIGAFGIFNYLSIRRLNGSNDTGEKKFVEEEIEKLSKEITDINKKVGSHLEGIPLKQNLMDNVDENIIKTLFRICETYMDKAFVEEDIKRLEGDKDEVDRRIAELLKQVSIEDYIDLGLELNRLYHRYEYITEVKARNRELDIRLMDNKANLNQVDESLRAIKDKIDDMEVYLKQADSHGDAFEHIKTRYRITRALDLARDTLMTIKDKPTKQSVIDSAEYTIDYQTLKDLKSRCLVLDDEIKSKEILLARYDEKIKSYKNSGLDDIESEILMTEDELAACISDYDRYSAISSFIRLTEKKYKEENQPDIIKNASKYFSVMTENRYTDIYIDTGEESRDIYLKKYNENIPVSTRTSLSKGTLNQLYLAIRLGIIESLEEEETKLPLIFDELFSNWDEDRLDKTLELINSLAKDRQLILFTCNPWLKGKLEGSFNTEAICL